MTGPLQRRRSAALVAAGLAAATALSACSSSGDNNKTSSTGGGGGSDKGPIKIGVEIPTSGPLASAGTVYGLVAKALGTSQIPGTDTIDGRKVQIVSATTRAPDPVPPRRRGS